ncbi:MAG: PadR family transcriptional regulator [Anaerolineae bacterium]|nr:PadR family transcriptional regulator [Anaerolineae bacterium]
MADRELTTLEHIVLGLIAEEAQSGYSIISALESGSHRWSASPGSVYPILKRLEAQACIVGELELVYETRPRKMYTLTDHGSVLLDQWLRAPLSWSEVLDERDVVLVKFLFMEKRLPRAAVIGWLDAYEQLTDEFDPDSRIFHDAFSERPPSLHQQLIHEATMLELNMQRSWIQMTRRRLQTEPERTEHGSTAQTEIDTEIE